MKTEKYEDCFLLTWLVLSDSKFSKEAIFCAKAADRLLPARFKLYTPIRWQWKRICWTLRWILLQAGKWEKIRTLDNTQNYLTSAVKTFLHCDVPAFIALCFLKTFFWLVHKAFAEKRAKKVFWPMMNRLHGSLTTANVRSRHRQPKLSLRAIKATQYGVEL